jgi:hypothetical protein
MSQSSIDKMKYFTENLSSTEIKEINMDFLNLVHICNVQYSRNIYKKDAEWKTVKADCAFDYDFIKHNNSVTEFDYIRKRINFFSNVFFERRTRYKRDLILKEINKISIMLYENFVIQSIEIMINNIIIPISCPIHDLVIIKNKYAHLKKQKKSNKINYEIYNQLCV